MNLYEALKSPPATKPEIIIQRSEAQEHKRCARQAHFRQHRAVKDADVDRLRNVGSAFHDIMRDYLSDLLATQQRADPDALRDRAASGPADLQPDLNWCAKLTAPRVGIWQVSYVSHETQYAYKVPNLGPHGETVVFTCQADLLERGDTPSEFRIRDWKTGWAKSGHEFQAMFYAVVIARSLENCKSVTWQPFYCRFGTWGRAEVFEPEDIDAAEGVIRGAAMDMLSDTTHDPNPGFERCRICAYVELCDASRRFADIETNPEAFAAGTQKLAEELKARYKAMTAYVKGHGPILLDGEWYGANPIKDRVTFRWNKGTPAFCEDDNGTEPENELT